VGQLIFRFLAGGVIVTVFAALADALKPKSFAGLFGAAPSVGLATLTFTSVSQGTAYAALEARSMMAGAAAFLVYACISSRMMLRWNWHAAQATIVAMTFWFGLSFALWYGFLR
jgi:hypothetical protein